jgi:hypothetical protein
MSSSRERGMLCVLCCQTVPFEQALAHSLAHHPPAKAAPGPGLKRLNFLARRSPSYSSRARSPRPSDEIAQEAKPSRLNASPRTLFQQLPPDLERFHAFQAAVKARRPDAKHALVLRLFEQARKIARAHWPGLIQDFFQR